MEKYNHFSREYDLIQDVVLRNTVVQYMEKIVPDYFGRLVLLLLVSITPNFHRARAVWFATLRLL